MNLETLCRRRRRLQVHDEERIRPAAGQTKPQHRGRAGRPGRRGLRPHLCRKAPHCDEGGGQADHADREVQGGAPVYGELELQGDQDPGDHHPQGRPRKGRGLLGVKAGAYGISEGVDPAPYPILHPT